MGRRIDENQLALDLSGRGLPRGPKLHSPEEMVSVSGKELLSDLVAAERYGFEGYEELKECLKEEVKVRMMILLKHTLQFDEQPVVAMSMRLGEPVVISDGKYCDSILLRPRIQLEEKKVRLMFGVSGGSDSFDLNFLRIEELVESSSLRIHEKDPFNKWVVFEAEVADLERSYTPQDIRGVVSEGSAWATGLAEKAGKERRYIVGEED